MKAFYTVIVMLLFGSLACAEETVQVNSKLLSGFIKEHCLQCHGASDPEGDLRLDNLGPELSTQESIRNWHRVFNALRNEKMPPEDEPRPDAGKLKAVVDHLYVTLSAAEPLVGRPPQYKAEGIEIPDANAEEPLAKIFSQQAAVQYLDDGAVAWANSYRCIACHTSGTYMAERPVLTKTLGPPREEMLKSFTDAVNTQAASKGDFWYVWRSLGLAQWDKHVTGKLSEPAAAALREMFSRQQEDGTWDMAQRRIQIPHVTTRFELAVQAARAVTAAPGWLDNLEEEDLRQGVERLKTYLREHEPRHDYELALMLRVDTLLPGVVTPQERDKAIAMLRREQLDDGGWSTRRMSDPSNWSLRLDPRLVGTLQSKPDALNPGSDAYMTGLAIVLLRESGVPTADRQIQRGISWLKSRQRQSGRWWLESLTFPVRKPGDTPGDKRRHFTTYIATAQAMRALDLCGELEPVISSK
ncbi:c-type cytochrome domain-containing protein [Lignipirellula cremea]|uniref:Planctomycete cytochrome C n=1 Tax=Lignipirellula cremea TaxID=2528010 RepID=A0A518DW75_9BACT|nr:c-type cytochrome domain-containing protein [Lignipirellula cremea]QDU96088.1 Planctomycete cytochrome C [Lignipirellula cremea]